MPWIHSFSVPQHSEDPQEFVQDFLRIRLPSFWPFFRPLGAEFAMGRVFHRCLHPAPRIDFRLLVSGARARLDGSYAPGGPDGAFLTLSFPLIIACKSVKKKPHDVSQHRRSPPVLLSLPPNILSQQTPLHDQWIFLVIFTVFQVFERWEETRRAYYLELYAH